MKRHWLGAAALVLSVCLCEVAAFGRQIVAPAGPPPTRPNDGPGAAPTGRPSEPALVTGRVVDGDAGVPVAGAVVSMLATGARESPDTPRVMTDSSGRFFFNEVAAGKFTVEAKKPGWISGAWSRSRPGGDTVPLELGAGETRREVTIRLWRYAVISGRVADESGDPLVATDVRIFRRSVAAGRRQFTFVTRAITDDRGMYRFSTLLPGDYVIAVPGTVTSEPSGLRDAAELPSLYMQTMTGVGTAPVVSSNRADGTAGANRPFVSSMLNLPSMPVGEDVWTTFATTYFPSATLQSSATPVQAVSGRERTGTDITIRFTRTFQVSGSLTLPDGGAAAFHAVHLVAADAGANPLADVGTAVTDGRGAFTFFGVPPGDYVARVVRTPAPGTPGSRLGMCGGTGAITFLCATSNGPPPSGAPNVPGEDLLYADQSVVVADRNVEHVMVTLAVGPTATGRLEFDGAATKPGVQAIRNISVWFERADGLQFQLPGGYSLIEPGRFADDGRLTMPSTWPGRYLVRITQLPPGWFVKSVTHEGRDIFQTAFDLRTSLSDVVVTLTDRLPTIEGTVQAANGSPDTSPIVLLFPADPAARVDYGRTSRRVQSALATGGRYRLDAPPPGEYFLIAIPDAQAADWQDPTQLERLARLAERVTVAEGQAVTRTLVTRRVP